MSMNSSYGIGSHMSSIHSLLLKACSLLTSLEPNVAWHCFTLALKCELSDISSLFTFCSLCYYSCPPEEERKELVKFYDGLCLESFIWDMSVFLPFVMVSSVSWSRVASLTSSSMSINDESCLTGIWSDNCFFYPLL